MFRYMGGKFRIAKYIAACLSKYITKDTVYIEPFVGGGWVLSEVRRKHKSTKVIASDINEDLINLYQAIQTRTT